VGILAVFADVHTKMKKSPIPLPGSRKRLHEMGEGSESGCKEEQRRGSYVKPLPEKMPEPAEVGFA